MRSIGLGVGALALGMMGHAAVAAAQEPLVAEAAAAARARTADVETVTRYARVLLRAGRYDEAGRVFHRVSQMRHGDPAALYEEASVGFVKNDFRVARNACRALEGRHRETVYYHVCMARSFLTLNRSERAFERLAAALAIDPNAYVVQLAVGEAHRIRMEFEVAEHAYLRAIELEPERPDAHLGLGRLYRAAGRRDDALAALRRARSLDPAWPAVALDLGAMLPAAEGLALLREGAVGCPVLAEGQLALGEAELLAGTPEAARAAFAKAVELDEHLAPAHVGLGRALARLGRDAEAELALRHALTMVPNSTPSYMTLAEIQARAELYEEAFESYRRAADGSPGDPTPLLTAAQLAMATGRDTLGQAFLDRLLAMNDRVPLALVLYGDIMVRRRDHAAAVRAYEQALALPDVPERARVEAALAEARTRAAARR